MHNLTENQRKALRGELPLAEYEAEGMGLWKLGLVGIDPLATLAGGQSNFVLTERGIDVARGLRTEADNG